MKKKIYNYSINTESGTLEQFKNCYEEKFVTEAALMPDAHLGYSAPIGAVLKTKGFVVPAWVGFDIGCGMIAIKFFGKGMAQEVKKNADKIYSKVIQDIPMGVGEYNKEQNITEKTKREFNKLLARFQTGPYDKNIFNYLKSTAIRHLGTLGGGNHFIELSTDDEQFCGSEENKKIKSSRAKLRAKGKELWLIIHSGSRGIGHTVAKKYMIKASNSKTDYEKTFPLDVNSQLGKEYLNLLDFGLEYALLNRLEMSYKVVCSIEKVLDKKIKASLWVNKNHNHAICEHGEYIHRKGATPAKRGERGVIPGNMRDGCFLVEGKGNSKFLQSSSHGAGRIMSRTEAKKKYSMEDFKQSMSGIKGTISQSTLDEIPMAYKNIFDVMKAQKDSIKIIKYLKPIINWKGE